MRIAQAPTEVAAQVLIQLVCQTFVQLIAQFIAQIFAQVLDPGVRQVMEQIRQVMEQIRQALGERLLERHEDHAHRPTERPDPHLIQGFAPVPVLLDAHGQHDDLGNHVLRDLDRDADGHHLQDAHQQAVEQRLKHRPHR